MARLVLALRTLHSHRNWWPGPALLNVTEGALSLAIEGAKGAPGPAIVADPNGAMSDQGVTLIGSVGGIMSERVDRSNKMLGTLQNLPDLQIGLIRSVTRVMQPTRPRRRG